MFSADLYEISMAASYLRRDMREPATFSLFVRDLPRRRGFLVTAGLETALALLETFEVTGEDVRRLADLLQCKVSFVRPLTGLRFCGSVVAVPEGRVVLAEEPLLEVTAPLPQAQLVEGLALNAITYQTAIATKAVRCVTAAGDRPVVDFALRRTHGLEAADAVARVSAIAGFAATSNIRAAPARTARHGHDGPRTCRLSATKQPHSGLSPRTCQSPRRSWWTPTTWPAGSTQRRRSSTSWACSG
jgi:nicotinate phosphoribosyltransferase